MWTGLYRPSNARADFDTHFALAKWFYWDERIRQRLMDFLCIFTQDKMSQQFYAAYFFNYLYPNLMAAWSCGVRSRRSQMSLA